MRAAVYIHIPFCVRKCAYCDFESYAGKLCFADEYIESVVREARLCRDEYGALGVPSVYIGGGTPSLLNGKQLARLTDALGTLFQLETNAEISMEANPGTLDAEKLKAFRTAGVNRLSFGAQAYQPRLLEMLGRIHRWDEVERTAEWARAAGMDNYNIDLMYALPGQTMEDFEESVVKALELKPRHLSCYSLILEEGTPITKCVQAGELKEPDDDDAVKMQHTAARIAARSGMDRYEISNYAVSGFECRHNVTYWTRGNYLGLGCAAHSLMNETRFENPSFDDYMAGSRKTEARPVTETEAAEEAVMLETRMTKGLDLNGFADRFGADALSRILNGAKRLEKMKLLRVADDRLALTEKGMDVHNAVVLELVSQLDEN